MPVVFSTFYCTQFNDRIRNLFYNPYCRRIQDIAELWSLISYSKEKTGSSTSQVPKTHPELLYIRQMNRVNSRNDLVMMTAL